MRVVSVDLVKKLVAKVGVVQTLSEIVERLKVDFLAWDDFDKCARHAAYSKDGVIELMPVVGHENYAVKIVNGHPENPQLNKLTVCGLGLLYDVKTGYPLLFSEMTLLTAFRTAATAALAAGYLARKDASSLGIIGCGAQSEFQILAHHAVLGIDTVYYFDLDAAAMQKFKNNLDAYNLNLIAAESVQDVINKADVVITATAAAKAQMLFKWQDCKPGLHISAIGGDGPGKTELDPEILQHAQVVVEYFPQTKVEGESQNMQREPDASLWELVAKQKNIRTDAKQITVFDSVGFALEDYSTLMWLQQKLEQFGWGQGDNFIPEAQDPKDLFCCLQL